MASDGKVVIDVELDDKDVSKSVDNMEQEFESLGSRGAKAFKGLASAAGGIGLAVGAAASAGIAAIGGLVESTAELNSDLARLKANASAAGMSFGSIEAGYKKVAAVSGEMDSAVETMSNLMATDFSENQIAEALDYINGAAIKFSDTLKTEGIADGLQETFATGEAIGPFAELLERSGVNLDTFNAGLAQAAATGSETDYVLQQLSGLGLASVYEEYQKANPAIVAYNEASTNLQTALADLGLVFTPLVTAAKNLATNLISLITNFDPAPFIAAFENLKSSVSINVEDVRAAAERAFNGLKTIIESVLNVVVPFVQEQVEKVKQFWSENGEQILQAVTNAFNGIKAVIDFVMPAIQFVIDFVWTAIKNVITGALDVIMGVVKTFSSLLTGDWSGLWDGIKQILSGAVDLILGIMSLTFVGGIRTALTNLAKTAINLVKGKWTSIVNLFKNATSSTWSTIKTWATNLVNSVKTMAANAVNHVKTLGTNMIAKIKEIPAKFTQVGKDIMQGLINGLKALNPVKVISSIAGSLVTSAKSALGIHSPSREFIAIGKDTIEGWVVGLQKTSPELIKTINTVSEDVLSVSEEFEKKQLELQETSAKELKELNDKTWQEVYDIRQKALSEKRALTTKELEQIDKIESDFRAEKVAKEKKLDKDLIKSQQDAAKETLSVIESFISDKKSLEQLSMLEEAAIWKESAQFFADGSNERIKAQQNYKKAIESIQKELVSINQTYSDQMLKIQEDLTKNTDAMWKVYDDEYNRRYNQLVNVAELFDKVDLKKESEEDLVGNLQSQVDALRLYNSEIEKLASRNISDALVSEIRNMGVDSLPELVKLNRMSEEQLQEFSSLYEERATLAREQTVRELSKLEKDVTTAVSGMEFAAAIQLEKLELEWRNQIETLTGNTREELLTLEQVGKDAGQSLLDGLSSMEGPLLSQAESIARKIGEVINSSLSFDANLANPLRGSSLNVGALSTPNITNNYNNSTYNNGGGDSQANIVVLPAPVNLDGQKVAEVTFEAISQKQQGALAIDARLRGVTT